MIAPSRTLAPLQFMGNFSIGLDLGGTNLRAAAVNESGKMLDQVSGKTEYSADATPSSAT